MKKLRAYYIMLLLFAGGVQAQQPTYTVLSPSGKIKLLFGIGNGQAYYAIEYNGKPVLQHSKLGIIREDEDFASNLSLQSVSAEQPVKDSYTIKNAKRSSCSYSAHKRIFHLKN